MLNKYFRKNKKRTQSTKKKNKKTGKLIIFPLTL